MKLLHRYSSTIHGNYRQAYLKYGTLCGLLMGGYVLLRWLMGNPESVPSSYAVDAILIIMIFLCGVLYRHTLENKQVTLKEMMLFGLGMAVIAAVVYGLLLWLIGLSFHGQTMLFTETMTGQTSDSPLRYWAVWWALVAGVETAVLGGLVAFLAAIFLRTEKAPLHQRKPKE